MEFRSDKSTLQKELSLINPVIEKKQGPLPILKYLLVEAEGKGLIRITGSDGDITLRTELEAEVKKEGRALVPAKSFFDLIRQMPDGTLVIRGEAKGRVSISIDSISTRLAGEPVDSYPQQPQMEEATTEMPAEIFRTMIENTIFAITQEDGRFQLAGAKFIVERSHAIMVATDGHRLSYVRNNQVGSKEKLSVLIPRKALSELAKLSGAHEGSIAFRVNDNQAFFRLGSRTLVTRLLTGQFPNFKTAIPTTNDKVVKLNASDLKESLSRMAVLATDAHRKVIFNLAPDTLTLEANSGDVGDGSERRNVVYAGDQLRIGFNAEYLSEFLAAAGPVELTLQLKDQSAQAVFIPGLPEAYDCRYVLCPVRI